MRYLLLLLFWLPVANAVDTTCTGGTGSDYGDMTCTVPSCDISTDPSVGCAAVGGDAGYVLNRCYMTGTPYLKSFCIIQSGLATCFAAGETGNRAVCNASPVGRAGITMTTTDISDGGGKRCYDLSQNFVNQFCKMWH